jgi:hypothetical protein
LAEEIKDIAAQLANELENVDNVARRVGNRLKESNKSLIDVAELAEKFARSWEGLPKNIKTGSDLLNKMKENSSLASKFQKEMHVFAEKTSKAWEKKAVEKALSKQLSLFKKIEEEDEKISDAMDRQIISAAEGADKIYKLYKTKEDAHKSFEETLQNIEEDREKLHKNVINDLDKQLKLQKENKKVIEDISFNAKNIVDNLGDKIRNPSKAFEGMLATAGAFPSDLLKAKEETGSWGKALKKVTSESGIGKFAKVVAKGGPIVIGLGAIAASVTVLYKLFSNYWDFIDKKVMPAQAAFNKEIGATSKGADQLRGQMISTGVQFELLGYSFEEGAAKVRELSAGMKTVKLDKETLKTGMELQAILGLTGEEAGQAALQFKKQTGSMKGLNEMLNIGAAEAKAWGVPVNIALKELAGAPNVLARFGVANRKEFAVSTARANSYGLSIKEMNAAFGKIMDSFDATAEASAKLNTIFGTNINSMELMLETDPTKRMEMLRGELERQGKSWEKLSVFEKNVITQNLGVDESQAALILSSEKEREKLERKQKIKQREIDINEKWNKGIGSIKKTLLAWGPLLDRLMRSITKFTSKVLFGSDATKDITNTAKIFEGILIKMTAAVQSASKSLGSDFKPLLGDIGDIFKDIIDKIKNFDAAEFGRKVSKTLNSITNSTAFKMIRWAFEKFFTADISTEGKIAESVVSKERGLSDLTEAELNNLMGMEDSNKVAKEIGVSLDKMNDLLFKVGDEYARRRKEIAPTSRERSKIIAEQGREQLRLFKQRWSQMSDEEKESYLAKHEKRVDDAIISKAGKIIKLNPNDNILATKMPLSGMIPKPEASATVMTESLSSDTKQLVKAIQQLATAVAPSSQAQVTMEPKIEVLSFEIDGKKIAEAQVRVSRLG